MRLRFTHSATRDLTRLRSFIAEKDPEAAARVSRRLNRVIRHLRDHPELGRPLEELPEVRELVAGNYIVRYTSGEATVTILTHLARPGGPLIIPIAIVTFKST